MIINFFLLVGMWETCPDNGQRTCSNMKIVKVVSLFETLRRRECIRYRFLQRCKCIYLFPCVMETYARVFSLSSSYRFLNCSLLDPPHKSSIIISNRTTSWNFSYLKSIAVQQSPIWSTIIGKVTYET